MEEKWEMGPEYIKLVDFLVEKSKNAKKMNIWDLGKVFKKETKSSESVLSLNKRIASFRLKIHKMANLDDDTKAKLFFTLNASVNKEFLEKLREQAEVKIDEHQRIIHYKKHGEELEFGDEHVDLSRRNLISFNEKERKLLKFLAEKVEQKCEIVVIRSLSEEFQKHNAGVYPNVKRVEIDYGYLKPKIFESDEFDEETKVKMMFATSTKVEVYALEKLRENATVVVDELNRIIKYQRNDGKLSLEGNPGVRKLNRKRKEEKDDKYLSEEEEVVVQNTTKINVTTKSGRLSKKRFSNGSFFNNQESPMENPKKQKAKTPAKKNNDTLQMSQDSDEFPVRNRNRPSTSNNNERRSSLEYYWNPKSRAQDIKLEPFEGKLKNDFTRGMIIDDGDDYIEEIPPPVESNKKTNNQMMMMNVKDEDFDVILITDPIIKSEPTAVVPCNEESFQSNDKGEQTPLLAALESLKALITALGSPVLDGLQQKIEMKMEEMKDGTEMIPVDGLLLAFEFCLLKVNRNATSEPSAGCVSLKQFLSNLRLTVLFLKFPSLVAFEEKLAGIFEEIGSQDKNVPVGIVQIALQATYDNIIVL